MWGVFRVGLGFILISVHRVQFRCEKQKTGKNREAEKQRSREKKTSRKVKKQRNMKTKSKKLGKNKTIVLLLEIQHDDYVLRLKKFSPEIEKPPPPKPFVACG